MIVIDGRTIHQLMPSCIEIYEGNNGLSIRSTRHIPVDTIVDIKVSFCFIDNRDEYYSLVIDRHHDSNDDCRVFPLHSFTNTLYYTETERVCNGYIGYLNHSCYYSNVRFVSTNQFEFSVISTRDIEANEELTSNYLLFDYTCHGHQFICTCCLHDKIDSADRCYGQVMGFKGLNYDQQCSLIDEVTPHVLHQYCQDQFDINIKELYVGIDKLDHSDDNIAVSYPLERTTRCTTRMDDKLIQKIKSFASSYNVSESILFVMCYMTLLGLIHGDNDITNRLCTIIVDSTCNNKATIHFIHNYFALSISEVINIITTQQVKGPPSRVIKHLLHIDSMAYSISHNNSIDEKKRISTLPKVKSSRSSSTSTPSDLHLNITTDYSLQWMYSKKYDRLEVMAMEQRYLCILEQILDIGWDAPMQTLRLLDDNDIDEVLRLSRSSSIPSMKKTMENDMEMKNEIEKEPKKMLFIHDLIVSNALINPNKIAVECGKDTMTYDALVQRMTIVAHALRSVGVRPDDVVGILMPRGCDMVVALLGISVDSY